MERIAQNPAAALRDLVEAARLPGFVAWDREARALLVLGAPRHGAAFPAALRGRVRLEEKNGLWRLDLPAAGYEGLLSRTFFQEGPLRAEWMEAQYLLAGLLRRPAWPGPPDVPLLRRALLATVQGEAPARDFIKALPSADALALRRRNTASIHACAALLAHWLWTEKSVGLPDIVGLLR